MVRNGERQMNKNVYVDELKQMDGLDVSGQFALAKKDTIREYRGGYYISAVISDRTGTMECRMWGTPDRDMVMENYNRLKVGRVYYLTGTVKVFREQVQLNVSLDDSAIEDVTDSADITDFLRAAERPIDDLMSELHDITAVVDDPDYRKLIDAYLSDEDIQTAMGQQPASKSYHHSYMGGLLEHTLGVVKLSIAASQLYDGIDRDLLITAALLHDIGKIREYTSGPVIDYTLEGSLLGQNYLTISEVDKLVSSIGEMDEMKKMKLMHILLTQSADMDSSHSVKPKMTEAVILNLADSMDSRIKAFLEVKEENKDCEDDMVFVPRRDINTSIYLR